MLSRKSTSFVLAVLFILFSHFFKTGLATGLCLNDDLINAFANGQANILFRARYEQVSTPNLSLKNGFLVSLRSQMGYDTADFLDTKLKLEMTHVATLLTGRYNSGIPGIGNPNYAVIPTVPGTGITQAYLKYTGFPNTEIIYGRQRIKLDDERFVGDNDFQQFPQSFDGFSIQTLKIFPETDLYYAFLHQQHTAFAAHSGLGRHQLRTHLIHAKWQVLYDHTMAGYAYLNRDQSDAFLSNHTYGIRATGTHPINLNTLFYYLAEYAYQHPVNQNPQVYQAHYYRAEIGLHHDLIFPILGIERLGGHATQAHAYFRMPLGSPHDFQGWSDFEIPQTGLRDFYFKLKAMICQFTLTTEYHRYRQTHHHHLNADLGSEIDLRIEKKLNDYLSVSLAYAKLNGKNDLTPTKKIWVSLIAQFG